MVLWFSFALVLIAAMVDLRKREIPDTIPLLLLAWAVTSTAARWHEVGWASLLLGFGAGLGLGLILFCLGGLGGGDVKLLAALGAAVGLQSLWSLLFYVALAGGVLAVIAKLRKQRELAYAPAIALGFLVFLIRKGEGQ